jgi:hypothetical protein
VLNTAPLQRTQQKARGWIPAEKQKLMPSALQNAKVAYVCKLDVPAKARTDPIPTASAASGHKQGGEL